MFKILGILSLYESNSIKSGCYFRESEDDSLVMSSTGINDAPGVLNYDEGRNYVGGEPNPVDRDQEIRSDIHTYINNTGTAEGTYRDI